MAFQASSLRGVGAGVIDHRLARRALIREYRDKFSTPYAAAERGFIDDVIEPSETRPRRVAPIAIADGLNEITLGIYGPNDDGSRALLVTYTWLEKLDAAD